ncbi:peptide MFS transporter [Sphingobium algorifonticola]|uniref:MFS transporter n=1 Tax=Sphingobium algorifonticola TaxID=2008318 RepID=A0A437J5Z0_9SPHN|nr:peptide MFS transporter [Sphingobium algorifonticola]RVT40362.1 MFS transporter [Sphingobium algorifonticola]
MATAASSRDWFGQPRGLTVLFLTEMWEKFSYYGMRALLVYYMTKELLFAPERASYVYGLYTALAYFTPIFGGYLSDRWLGRRRAILIGGTTMAIGHFLMAFPTLLFPALAVIAIGNGLYLPNLPSQVDQLYAGDDPRRGSAYNIYYVGVNLGAFLAPLVCGTLGEVYGWHYGFGAAGIGMVAGLAIYVTGGAYLPRDRHDRSPTPAMPGAPPEAVITDADETDGLRARIPLMLGVIGAVILFRGAYEQMGNSVALWADSDVDRVIGAFTVPATWFQSLNPLLVFLLTPLLVRRWTGAARRGQERSPLMKMAQGAAGLGIVFLAVALVSLLAEAQGFRPPLIVLIGFIILYTLAELFILPVGLGLFGRLGGNRFRATAIAAWFFAAFAGNLLAGYVGGFWSQMDRFSFFVVLATLCALASAILFILSRNFVGDR